MIIKAFCKPAGVKSSSMRLSAVAETMMLTIITKNITAVLFERSFSPEISEASEK